MDESQPGFWTPRRPLVMRAVLSLILATLANATMASTNLVLNSSLAITGGSTSFQFGTYNSYTPAEGLADWSSPGYNFVFLPTSTSATSTYGTANLTLYSQTTTPSNSFNNASPTGGNFMASDINYGNGAITQTINGLTPGKVVAISFAWAGVEQTGFSCTGTCTGLSANWTVQLGSSPAQATAAAAFPSQGFTGWLNSTFYFLPVSASEILSFIAGGTPPSGAPPFALLANVSATTVPEPDSAAVFIAAIAGLATTVRRRPRSRAGDVALLGNATD